MGTLTEIAIRNAKPGAKPVRLFDGQGLYLEITPAGGKLWRWKYRYAGKEKRLAIGKWPAMKLATARLRASDARALLADGRDPGEVKRADKLRVRTLVEDSFQAVAKEWFDQRLSQRSVSHRSKVWRRLEMYVFPHLGRRPVAEITAPEVLAVVRRVEALNKIESAHRTLQVMGQVLRYAESVGKAQGDPTRAAREGMQRVSARHFAAPADDPARVGEILRAQDAFKGSSPVKCALQLLPLLFCRPGELRTMRWADVDLDAGEWRYTVSKTGQPHLVPLSRQAVALLRELFPLTGHLRGGWVFPGGRSPMRPMSDAAINAALRRLGIDTRDELTGHGWRAVARTMLHERLGSDPYVIEHQLAHAVPDALGTSYNRTRFLKERKAMMQRWADYLDALREGAEVMIFTRERA